ncbi:hypothetical protein ACM22J_08805 [Glaesserella parasuis]|uniref:hypothetical protein n=1 Tax=Glaesserella parasuis TaxID=738 RepID=UPI0021BDB34B|nr:hypothetical protein [Glaesserella parasuis]MCT8672732.1 hypothetical protein [Glaesserella parasuis]MCT8687040.1 hypothetical protein [Glaesserella parasuis]MCT8697539.1 hypothetical protein [Glaesserella parasuis]MCT8742061.1 hypothetical protein [Glaesserella parasuis]
MRNQNKIPSHYALDEQAQECLKNGIKSLWEAYTILEFVQKTLTDEEMLDHYTALNGVLALMSKGLDDLAEV